MTRKRPPTDLERAARATLRAEFAQFAEAWAGAGASELPSLPFWEASALGQGDALTAAGGVSVDVVIAVSDARRMAFAVSRSPGALQITWRPTPPGDGAARRIRLRFVDADDGHELRAPVVVEIDVGRWPAMATWPGFDPATSWLLVPELE